MPVGRPREGCRLAVGGGKLVGEKLQVQRGEGFIVRERATRRYIQETKLHWDLAAAASTSGVRSRGWKTWPIINKASTRHASPARIAGG